MSAGQVATVPAIGPATPARLSVLAAVFAIGIVVGLAVPRFVRGPTAEHQVAAVRSQAVEITPTLVSEPYLTIQHGIVVPPTSFVATPALVSEPYLTIQHGIVVPPTSFVATPALVSEPYLTIQHGIVVPPAP
jgi:multisubunit Na+/H+ antiporter MnhF subunit